MLYNNWYYLSRTLLSPVHSSSLVVLGGLVLLISTFTPIVSKLKLFYILVIKFEHLRLWTHLNFCSQLACLVD